MSRWRWQGGETRLPSQLKQFCDSAVAPRLDFRVFCGVSGPEKNEISQIIYFILDCQTPASQAARREQADYPDAL